MLSLVAMNPDDTLVHDALAIPINLFRVIYLGVIVKNCLSCLLNVTKGRTVLLSLVTILVAISYLSV